jgi:hypothetical protein
MTTAAIPTVLYCLFKNAVAPSFMACATSAILPSLDFDLFISLIRKKEKNKENKETIIGINSIILT